MMLSSSDKPLDRHDVHGFSGYVQVMMANAVRRLSSMVKIGHLNISPDFGVGYERLRRVISEFFSSKRI